ncbi:hypothetical protein ANCCAN_00985 [Ancylostoma caninum]|uniref:Uncharacterized protein n=1 Tax=Ancylostoma caninum TaxID=29170 RepID=A0A368HBC3_ANCCA|nr:hypothetical protein ANCCAN_00985 [Ancylostoma caninum]
MYIINTKWIDDDETAAHRWQQLTNSAPIPRSGGAEERSSESGTSYAETMWGNISSVIDDSARALEEPPAPLNRNAHSSSSGNTSTSSHLVPLGEDRTPKEPSRISSAGDKPTLGGSTQSEDPTSTVLDECGGPPWQNLLEMLSIRIIILEKTKLPAGDQRQFGDLASNKGTVIFVVATDGVRVF